LPRANPIWLVAAPYLWPNAVGMGDYLGFLGMSLIVSAAFIALAATQLRRVAAREGNRPRPLTASRIGSRIVTRCFSFVPGPSLDANPVLWREWHRRRPSRWSFAVWSLYGVMTVGLTLALITSSAGASPAPREVASIGNGFQAGIGLLLLSVSAATALAEERVRGNLDVLLATPLPTRSIVWGKWCGAFRAVPIVAICPGLVAAALARESGRWDGVVLIIGLFLAYGAAVTSLGLALATWIRRLDFAVAFNVAVLGGVTVGWLFVIVLTRPGPAAAPYLAAGSPIIGIPFPTVAMYDFSPADWSKLRLAWTLWIVTYTLAASALLLLTLITFNRCLGRMTFSKRQWSVVSGQLKRRR
jgi:ABC-type transport system involved in multi-copper enzyme maturation permease subunit